MHSLENLHFDNSFARLPAEFYSAQPPAPLLGAHTVSVNPAAAPLLGLEDRELQRPELALYFGGHRPLPGAEPVAQVYAGHQFGVYVPRLGDGRGLLLGETLNDSGERLDLHLKGAGKTPYSRFGDGRAVLRSTIREYLCSEALHALGIPSTRALCIIGSTEPVYREEVEQGATLLRLARTHVRFGHFEFFYYTRREDLLRRLADYTLEQYHPELCAEADRHRLLFQRAVHATAELIGQWQAWGFAHGVMNTDNMSILGETIDYGPFGFLNEYDPEFICNHSDHGGRYAYKCQPSIGLWNCAALAQALSPLVEEKALKEILGEYGERLYHGWLGIMRQRLGLQTADPDDAGLIDALLKLLEREKQDYHRSLRALCEFTPASPWCALRDAFIDRAAFDDWAQRYARRLRAEPADPAARCRQMQACNPLYVLRNHLAHTAIRRAVEDRDYSEVDRLLGLVQAPFAEQPGAQEYAEVPPEWGRELQVSCSS